MLDKKTRLRLTFQIMDAFNEHNMTFDSTNLVLRTYGLKTLPEFEGPTLHDILGDATDTQLVELAEYFGLETPDAQAPEARVATVASARPLFVFGSHLSAQRVLVGDVRQELLRYGIDLFVAHDTIAEDTLWQVEIEKALDRADAGLVFVHKGLKDSPWCDQEIGWMQGRHVPVMALRFDEVPYGFFAKHQAQAIPPWATAATIAAMTVDRIASRPELAAGFAASLVSAMADSPNFATTDAIWKRLRELTSLDADLCAQLLEATKRNTQIFWANSPWDDHVSYQRVVPEFLRRQTGAAVIASDIDAYMAYLDAEDADALQRAEAARRRLDEQLSSGGNPSDPF